MKQIDSVKSLEDFGRVRLSKSFFMRDFLFSDIAAIHGLNNLPKDPDLAIKAGMGLCENLLEPLQEVFGRIAIRSAYRSEIVNDFGNKNKLNCASNESNYAKHIWDKKNENGHFGATACIAIPAYYDAFNQEGDWQKLAWWIHDKLPYSTMYFFPKFWAFNLNWCENPTRRIDSYTNPKGNLTQIGKPNFSGCHKAEWQGLMEFFPKTE